MTAPMNLKELLKGSCFFKSFSPEEIKKIEAIAERKVFPAGATIFKEFSEASAMFLLEKGSVRITKEEESIEIAIIGPGGTFGEMPFLDGGKRSATANAIDESHLIKIPYTTLMQTLLNQEDLAIKFYESAAKFVSRRLRETTEDLKKAKEFMYRHF